MSEKLDADNRGRFYDFGFTLDLEPLLNSNPLAISYVAKDNEQQYLVLDDGMRSEVWLRRLPSGNYDIEDAVYRSKNSTKVKFAYWGAEDDGADTIIRVELCRGYEIPLNIKVVNKCVVDELVNGAVLKMHITAVPENVSFYETQEQCTEGNGEYAAESLVPIGTFYSAYDGDEEYIGDEGVLMSAKVKSYELLKNQLTGLEYVHFTVQTLENTFDVVVNAEEIDLPLEQISYLSGTFDLKGYVETDDYHRYGQSFQEMYEAKLTEAQFAEEIVPVLRDMRDLECEYLVADFSKAADFPLSYVQTTLEQEQGRVKDYLVEYGIILGEGKVQLFRLKKGNRICGLEEVRDIFHTVCVEGKEPLAWEWEDISHILGEERY